MRIFACFVVCHLAAAETGDDVLVFVQLAPQMKSGVIAEAEVIAEADAIARQTVQAKVDSARRSEMMATQAVARLRKKAADQRETAAVAKKLKDEATVFEMAAHKADARAKVAGAVEAQQEAKQRALTTAISSMLAEVSALGKHAATLKAAAMKFEQEEKVATAIAISLEKQAGVEDTKARSAIKARKEARDKIVALRRESAEAKTRVKRNMRDAAGTFNRHKKLAAPPPTDTDVQATKNDEVESIAKVEQMDKQATEEDTKAAEAEKEVTKANLESAMKKQLADAHRQRAKAKRQQKMEATERVAQLSSQMSVLLMKAANERAKVATANEAKKNAKTEMDKLTKRASIQRAKVEAMSKEVFEAEKDLHTVEKSAFDKRAAMQEADNQEELIKTYASEDEERAERAKAQSNEAQIESEQMSSKSTMESKSADLEWSLADAAGTLETLALSTADALEEQATVENTQVERARSAREAAEESAATLANVISEQEGWVDSQDAQETVATAQQKEAMEVEAAAAYEEMENDGSTRVAEVNELNDMAKSMSPPTMRTQEKPAEPTLPIGNLFKQAGEAFKAMVPKF